MIEVIIGLVGRWGVFVCGLTVGVGCFLGWEKLIFLDIIVERKIRNICFLFKVWNIFFKIIFLK